MNNLLPKEQVKLTKVKEGRGWYLDVEDVIFNAPLTAVALLKIYAVIADNLKEIKLDLD